MLKRRSVGVVLTVATVLRSCTANAESLVQESLPKRQDTPDISASSIDWWPYPAYQSWAQVTTPSITSPARTPITSFVAAASVITSDATNTGISTASTPTASAVVAPNTTSSGSMVYITALPPASTPRRAVKRPTKSSFNLAYLAPVFVVVGILVGMLATWLIFFCSRGHWTPRRRASSFKYGPKYVPPTERTRVAGLPATADEESRGSRFLVKMKHGRRSLRESMFNGDSIRPSWFKRGRTAHHREAAGASPAVGTQETPGPAERSYRENDPFLSSAGPSTRLVVSPDPVSPALDTRSPVMRCLHSRDVFADNDEGAAVHYETVRPNSIQRSILERLKSGSRYRGGHKKADSDVQIDLLRDGAEYEAVSTVEELTPSRASTSNSGLTQGVPLPLVRNGTSGPGFMVIEDDPDSDIPSPSQDGGMLGLNWKLPWIASPDKLGNDDKFTAMPSRRSLAEKRTPGSSPGISRTTSSNSAKASTAQDLLAPSVLPIGPPRVTSPPFEAQLFFGGVPEFGSAPHLDLDFPPRTKPVGVSSPLAATPPSRTKKLHTKRSPPLLPFPSAGSKSPYRNRLTKTSAESPSPARAYTSPAPSGNKPSPAARYAQRHEALNKVDEILARSWSARDSRGEERISSPTMFGAVPDSGTAPQGIEQRLFAQKRS